MAGFTLTAPTGPPANLGITVSANRHRPRETVVGFPGPASPSSTSCRRRRLSTRRSITSSCETRYERPEEVYPTFRWQSQMRFYVRTIDETLRVAAPEVLATVRQAIREGVRAFSGGRYEAIIEEGTATRAEQVGWINVLLLQEIPGGDYCGLATLGGRESDNAQIAYRPLRLRQRQGPGPHRAS